MVWGCFCCAGGVGLGKALGRGNDVLLPCLLEEGGVDVFSFFSFTFSLSLLISETMAYEHFHFSYRLVSPRALSFFMITYMYVYLFNSYIIT